ncbi:ParB/RepB/Spo0J family partition protein [bacterium]|nr:ParB/RepB/Spo0J family partition protein [bacterium]
MQKRALGRGLEALIPSLKETVKFVEINKVVPNKFQPRKNFDADQMTGLIESIKEDGVLQPVAVKPLGDNYEIIFGERRWRAAKVAGLKTIPIIIRDADNKSQLKLALVENLQRVELNAIEAAGGYKALIEEFNLSQEDVAKIVSKNRSSVANTLRLLKLPQNIQNEIKKGTISEGHGRVLLSLPPEEREKLYKQLLEGRLFSVRETERIAQARLLRSGQGKKKTEKKDAQIQYIEDQLQKALGTKVILKTGRKRGSIVIEYYSNDDLSRILEMIGVKI